MDQKHIHIDDLERYELKSPLLSEERRLEITFHLSVCDDCAERAEEIGSFYGDIEPVDMRVTSEAVERILARSRAEAQAPRIYELFPKRRLPASGKERPSIVALAAQETNLHSHFTPAGTLSSTDGAAMLRLTHNNVDQTILLQVHADSPELYSHVLVTFDVIGGEYVTNEAGEAVIPDKGGLSFCDAHAFIRVSMDTFDINKQMRTGPAFDLHGKNGGILHVEMNTVTSKCAITLKSDTSDGLERTLAIITGRATHVYTIVDRSTEIDCTLLDAAGVLVMY